MLLINARESEPTGEDIFLGRWEHRSTRISTLRKSLRAAYSCRERADRILRFGVTRMLQLDARKAGGGARTRIDSDEERERERERERGGRVKEGEREKRETSGTVSSEGVSLARASRKEHSSRSSGSMNL